MCDWEDQSILLIRQPPPVQALLLLEVTLGPSQPPRECQHNYRAHDDGGDDYDDVDEMMMAMVLMGRRVMLQAKKGKYEMDRFFSSFSILDEYDDADEDEDDDNYYNDEQIY